MNDALSTVLYWKCKGLHITINNFEWMFYVIPHLSVHIGYSKQSSNASIRLQTNYRCQHNTLPRSDTADHRRASKGAATRYDSPARSLPIDLYMGQS